MTHTGAAGLERIGRLKCLDVARVNEEIGPSYSGQSVGLSDSEKEALRAIARGAVVQQLVSQRLKAIGLVE